MGYYDSVKDDVKEKASKENDSLSDKSKSTSSSSGSGSFNTLKESAQETSEEEQ